MNAATPPRFLTDENGQRIAVVLDIAEYEKMVEELQDIDDIRVCNERLASGETPVPYVPLSQRTKQGT